jgi:hypothetical protein
MNLNSSTQMRTFKKVEATTLTDEDIKWIRSLNNVSKVESQKKSIVVTAELIDSMSDIIGSIKRKYCNSAKAKLKPLF